MPLNCGLRLLGGEDPRSRASRPRGGLSQGVSGDLDDAFDGPYERRWSVAGCYLRGMGSGRVARVDGVDAVQKKVGKWVEEARLPTVGAPKSDSYEGDGYVIVKDRDTDTVKKVVKTIIEGIKIHYA